MTCDITEDTELLLGPKVPLLISDMRREADDRSGSGLCSFFHHLFKCQKSKTKSHTCRNKSNCESHTEITPI